MSSETVPPEVLGTSSPRVQVQGLTRVSFVSAPGSGMRWYFTFFFVSGFCSILYELVWLRLAMAQFGVNTALVSIVLSMFMAGLGLGSWGAGYLVRKYGARFTSPPLRLYAVAELFIACSAVIVPLELQGGRWLLEHLGDRFSQSFAGYYVAAGIWLAITLIPWCACMGGTIPLAMFAIRSDRRLESRRSFSFLYLSNVLGAVSGAFVPLLIIELFGFRSTLRVGMFLNLALFVSSFALTLKASWAGGKGEFFQSASSEAHSAGWRRNFGSKTLWLLFATGLTSMGLEVVWIRQFTPYVGTFVYSFAQILALYLGATFVGSSIYRAWSRRYSREGALVWLVLWLAAMLPLVSADPTLRIPDAFRVALGIVPFSGLLGFLTPMLADRWSEGDPNRAGTAYAVNVMGCILGPLLAGFLLVPWMGERHALLVLSLPWLAAGVALLWPSQIRELVSARALVAYGIGLVSLLLVFGTQTFEQQFPGRYVQRDSTATVMAFGRGMQKELLVNGVGVTNLTPITKMMSALPLAFLDRPPQNALVICFGMGTTHRSMLSWGISSTAVELVPSVPSLFWYYHADGNELLRSPRSRVVIDDGRRFLERIKEQYDVIVIDPPPPYPAAASGLLYSREFYGIAKQHLRPGGILQQWLPGDADPATQVSVARAVQESFPYVRVFVAVDGRLGGFHFLASRQPIPNRTAAELAKRMPPAAVADLLEWGTFSTAEQGFAVALHNEVPIGQLISQMPNVPAMRDNYPVNEYYLLRKTGLWLYGGRWGWAPDGK